LPQKQLLAVVAAADYMVDRPGVFDTLLAWHPLSMAPNKTPFQCLYSTFDPFFYPVGVQGIIDRNLLFGGVAAWVTSGVRVQFLIAFRV